MKVADMHCDTVSVLYDSRRNGCDEELRENSRHIDLCKMKKGDALVQNFALFVNAQKAEEPLVEALRMADLYYEELAKNEDVILPVFGWKDIVNNAKEGKISAILTIEEGAVCKGDIAILRNLYRLGVRMMTLTWNYPNEIGYPNVRRDNNEMGELPFYLVPDEVHGLTEKGVEIVREMERLGMIIDVSHLSDAGFYDVWRNTQKPFVASHSNARAVCPWVRNLTDDMLLKLAERGGVAGLNFCPDFLEEESEGVKNQGTIDAIIRHARHIINVGGTDCLGMGSDFDGIDGHFELPDYSCFPLLFDAFCKAGFRNSEIEKIFYKNVLRVYRELL